MLLCFTGATFADMVASISFADGGIKSNKNVQVTTGSGVGQLSDIYVVPALDSYAVGPKGSFSPTQRLHVDNGLLFPLFLA
jgi:hypothetical protein